MLSNATGGRAGRLRWVGLYAALAALVCQLVQAAGPLPEIQSAGVERAVSGGTVSFASVDPAALELVLSVESANVSIKRRAGTDAISVSSNCPGHWNVTRNVIRQAGLSTTQKGVSLKADASGAHMLVNGRIYQLPRDADGAVRSLKVKDGVVTVNGRKLEPLPGSDVPGNCTGPDQLEIIVPERYGGGLIISCRGASRVAVDRWTGGNFVASLSGTADFAAETLKGLEKAVIDINGDSKARIKSLASKAFVANINGAGKVEVESGQSDLSNATVSGAGTMTLRGKFRNLKKSVSGTGTIDVAEQ